MGLRVVLSLFNLFSLYLPDFLQRSHIPSRIRVKYRKSELRRGPVTPWPAQLPEHGPGTAATSTAQTAGGGLWQREHLLGPVSTERGRTRAGPQACPRALGRRQQVGLRFSRSSFLDSLPAPQRHPSWELSLCSFYHPLPGMLTPVSVLWHQVLPWPDAGLESHGPGGAAACYCSRTMRAGDE